MCQENEFDLSESTIVQLHTHPFAWMHAKID